MSLPGTGFFPFSIMPLEPFKLLSVSIVYYILVRSIMRWCITYRWMDNPCYCSLRLKFDSFSFQNTILYILLQCTWNILKDTIGCVTKLVSTNSGRLKLYQAYSNVNVLKLEINCNKEIKKPTNMWRLNNILKNDWDKEETKGEL